MKTCGGCGVATLYGFDGSRLPTCAGLSVDGTGKIASSNAKATIPKMPNGQRGIRPAAA